MSVSLSMGRNTAGDTKRRKTKMFTSLLLLSLVLPVVVEAKVSMREERTKLSPHAI